MNSIISKLWRTFLLQHGKTAALALAVGSWSCGGTDEPVNFNGTYTTTITNKANGCEFANWMVGNKTQNVEVVMATDATDAKSVVVTVQGFAGGFLELFVGSRIFISNTNGNEISGLLLGRESTDAGCMQQSRIRINGKLNGDALDGTLTYGFVVKNPETCGIKASCATQQTIVGSRPTSIKM